jgi:non-ribosomal peptide synthetase component F
VENVRWLESTELPLTLCFTTGTNTHARLTYNPGQLDRASCHRTLERLRAALEGLVQLDPDAPDLSTLGVLAPAERLLLTTECAAECGWPASTVHELFERQAAATPEAPAIRDGAAALSYADLERRSRGLAAILRARGVGPERRVGIAQARSWRTIASVLGVLRSGAAYVPLDERWPTERRAYVMKEVGLRVVLTDRANWPLLDGMNVECSELGQDDITL